MRVLMIVLAGLTASCSWLFGDTFRDRSEGYLLAEEARPVLDTNGQPLVTSDAYPIPDLATDVENPTSFELPIPDRLVLNQTGSEQISTLSAYQSDALNPRLEKDGSGSDILRLDSSFANAWAVVTEAIAATRYKLSDLNRSIGSYYIEVERAGTEEDLGWWSRLVGSEPEPVVSTYILKMNRSGSGVYLSLQSDVDQLADQDLTHQVLSDLESQLLK